MKKAYVLIAVFIVTTSLIVAGCGNKEDSANKTDVNQTQELHNSKDMPEMDHSKM